MYNPSRRCNLGLRSNQKQHQLIIHTSSTPKRKPIIALSTVSGLKVDRLAVGSIGRADIVVVQIVGCWVVASDAGSV